MKYLITTLITLICFNTSLAITADEVLKSAADKYQKSSSLSANYSFTTNGNETRGSLISSGDKFHIYSAELSVWYDGRTQWSYTPATNEVCISEPTPEELQQINPFAIISAFRKVYKSSLLKSPKDTYKVQLLPIDNRASIRKVIVTMDSKTYYPSKIELTLDNNSHVTINVSNVKTGVKYSASTFSFDNSRYPHAEVVDLR